LYLVKKVYVVLEVFLHVLVEVSNKKLDNGEVNFVLEVSQIRDPKNQEIYMFFYTLRRCWDNWLLSTV
jgi:hypothetical protein